MITDDLQVLRQAFIEGQIIAVPTDTVLGFIVDGNNAAAVEKLYLLKNRPKDKPLIVLIDEVAQLEPLIQKPTVFVKQVMERFWPGKLTIVLKSKLGTTDSIAIRAPKHKQLKELLKILPGLVVSTSANISNEPVANSVSELVAIFGEQIIIWDTALPAQTKIASTIIDCTNDNYWTMLRQGAITKEEIWAVADR
ncbi:MAG: L-threonylcarbamoyladenylate synthase [Culicoidibacterales bacterium]